MARNYTSETLILSKKAWHFAKWFDRTQTGRKPLSNYWFEYTWNSCFRNGGANPATHPIADDEIRVDRNNFSLSLEEIKAGLTDYGFTYRQDGFITEGIDF